jgi:nucleoside-diphosphate-sugar epimerase
MRLLLTGATGYIGVRVAQMAVRAGWHVSALVRNQSNVARLPNQVSHFGYDGTMESIRACCTAVHPDAVIHLAAWGKYQHSSTDLARLIDANLVFGAQLLEAIASTGCTCLITAGTFWEYAADGSYSPKSLYAAIKRAFQDLVIFYCEAHALRAHTLVLYDVYGPGDWRNKLIPALVNTLRSGAHLPVTAGEQLLDLVYVDDVCEGFLKAAEEALIGCESRHQVHSLRSGRPVSIRELTVVLESLSGRSLDIGWGELAYRFNQIFRPTEVIPTLPGWAPRTSLEEGLRTVLDDSQPLDDHSTRPAALGRAAT